MYSEYYQQVWTEYTGLNHGGLCIVFESIVNKEKKYWP